MAISTQTRGHGAAILVHQMAKGARHFDPLRHTSLVSESWHEPAGGPWVRCRAAFDCWRDGWRQVLEYWITVRADADGAGLGDAVCDEISRLEDDAIPLVRGFDHAYFIGLVRP